MGIIKIDKTNIDSEHICCAIGNDKENKAKAQTKKNWLISQFDNGLIFKRLDERGKVFIEYMPIEKVWKPIVGKNYFVINCLWVSGQFKGKGYSKKLLEECINDAKAQNKDGIAVVSSSKNKPFLTDKKFYIKAGFELVDTASPYFELYVLKLNKDAEVPHFSKRAKLAECDNKNGFTIIFSNQCVFMEEQSQVMKNILKDMGYDCLLYKLSDYKDAQKNGSPFGTLGIYYNGKFISHELMPEPKFRKFITSIIGE